MHFGNYLALALVALFLDGPAHAEQVLPEAARDAIKKAFPDYSVDKGVIGDLVGSGDIAAFIVKGSSEQGWPSHKIVVFRHDASGYSLLDQSDDTTYSPAGEDWLEIRRKSLFVNASSSDLHIAYGDTYQFRYESGGFVLIGHEHRSSYTGDDMDSDEAKNAEYRISDNYLTGSEVIYDRHGVSKSSKTFPRVKLREIFKSLESGN